MRKFVLFILAMGLLSGGITPEIVSAQTRGGGRPVIERFTANHPTGEVPFSTVFRVLASTRAGSSFNYEWDFGDGESAETTERKIRYTYTRAGEFVAKVTVRDSAGRKATARINIIATAVGNDDPPPSDDDPPQPPPSSRVESCGIYALDTRGGTVNSRGLSLRDRNIRDYDFVSGYAWRMTWPDFEISQGMYDFSPIDFIIEQLEPLDQKLAISLLTREPSYIANTPGITTRTNANDGGNAQRAVPWDSFLQARFEDFIEALGDHQVYSQELGRTVALRDHPVLASINTGVPGFGSLREFGTEVSDLPGYTRDLFKSAVRLSREVITKNFPRQMVYMGFWNITDRTSSPTLHEDIRSNLLDIFDGVQRPRIGFFMDNLARETPTTGFADVLFRSQSEAAIGFQMLQAWNNPFSNAARTDNSVPADGIEYGYQTYGARYMEVYVVDLDDSNYWNDFREWNTILCR